MTPAAFPASDAIVRSLFVRCPECDMPHPCRCDASPSFAPVDACAQIVELERLDSADPAMNRRLSALYKALYSPNLCGCLESDCPLCNPEAARVIREGGRCNADF